MSDLGSFVKRLRDIMRNDAGINGDAQRIEQIAWMLFLKVYDAQEENWEFDDEDYVSIIPEECRWQNWAHDDGKGTALTGCRSFPTTGTAVRSPVTVIPDLMSPSRLLPRSRSSLHPLPRLRPSP